MMIQVYYAKASLMEMEAFRRESRVYLLVLAFLTVVALFYQADPLLGAVGVRPFYSIPGIILAVAFLLIAIWLPSWYGDFPQWASQLLSIVLIVAVVMANFTLVVLGWALATVFYCIPPQSVFFGLCIAFVAWGGATVHSSPPKLKLVRNITVVVSVFMAVYVFGIGWMPKHSEFTMYENVAFKDKHYFVTVEWGFLGDPDTLVLYKCNRFALFCTEAYQKTDEYFRNKNVELIPEQDDLIIRVDGNLLYAYQSKP